MTRAKAVCPPEWIEEVRKALLAPLRRSIRHQLETIMATQDHLLQALSDMSTQLTDVQTSVTALMSDTGQTTPAVDAAVLQLQGQVSALATSLAPAPAPAPAASISNPFAKS